MTSSHPALASKPSLSTSFSRPVPPDKMFPNLFTASLRITDLLGEPFRFAIPSYQRRYSWSIKEAAQLLDDLTSALGDDPENVEEPDYFLGAVLLTDVRGEHAWSQGIPRTPCKLDVVDGQQRLTTLSILLAAIRDLDASVGSDRIPSVEPSIRLADAATGQTSQYRLTLSPQDQEFFESHVLAAGACFVAPDTDVLSEPQRSILAVREHFLAALSDLGAATRRRLAAYVLERCHLVVIVGGDIDRGARMFTVLNGRGRPLSRTDIIKAEIVGGAAPAAANAVLAKWSNLEQRLGEDLEPFLSHVRTIHAPNKLAIIAGIRAIKDKVGGSEVLLDRLMAPMADAFDVVRGAGHRRATQSEAIERHLTYLRWLGASDWVPPVLLWMQRYPNEQAHTLAFLEAYERFAYLLRLLCISASRRATRFRHVLDAIRASAPLDSERSPLAFSRDEMRFISHNLRNLHARHPQTCKLILLRLNDMLAGAPQNLDPELLTVEHVLPQSPGRDSQWREWHPEPEERAACSRSLGNLVLVSRQVNELAANHVFENKRKIYFGTPDFVAPAITRDIASATEWRPADIKTREERLLNALGQAWGLDLTSDSRNALDERPGRRRAIRRA